jgi:acyl-CoA thioester hydrolase
MSTFVTEFVAGPEHIDQLGHVSNIEYLRWIVAAAEGHSIHAGYGEQRYRELGFVWVVRRHEIDYLVSARLGDVVRATTWVAEFRGASCVRATTLCRAGDDVVLARARTTWACISLTTGRPCRIPNELVHAFAADAELPTGTIAPMI